MWQCPIIHIAVNSAIRRQPTVLQSPHIQMIMELALNIKWWSVNFYLMNLHIIWKQNKNIRAHSRRHIEKIFRPQFHIQIPRWLLNSAFLSTAKTSTFRGSPPSPPPSLSTISHLPHSPLPPIVRLSSGQHPVQCQRWSSVSDTPTEHWNRHNSTSTIQCTTIIVRDVRQNTEGIAEYLLWVYCTQF